MLTNIKKFASKHQRGLKIGYLSVIVLGTLYAIYNIFTQTSWSTVGKTLGGMQWWQISSVILLGIISVVPMVIYDFVYVRKTDITMKPLRLLKNSYIINTFTNAGGAGGFTGATLRLYLLGKPSKRISENIKVVAQIALFTLMGLVTNDLLAMVLNIKQLTALPLTMKLCCFLFLIYIFVPFVSKNKSLGIRDYIILTIGSSLEWFFALGFFLSAGMLMGLHFNLIEAYLAVCFAGIIGAISLVPGGLGTFDSAIILGLSQLGISTSTAVAWALIYRVCYYFIPFAIGGILFLITFLRRKFSKK